MLMTNAIATAEGQGLLGLWVNCRSEKTENLAEPVGSLGGFPLRWEYAVSRSAAETGGAREAGRRGRAWGVHDLEILLNRMGLYDLVVVQPLSLNSLAKIALGIRDSLPATLVQTALASGKPVFISRSTIDAATAGGHPHLVKLYRRYWNDVVDGMVTAFAPDSLGETLEAWFRRRRKLTRLASKRQPGRAVITRDEVREAWQAMVPLIIPRDSLLTDLAREEAAALGVDIRFEDS